jgi:6-phosphogluconolactonase
MKALIKIYKSEGDLYHHAAGSIAGLIKQYILESGKCTFVLSGGITPRKIYLILGSEKFSEHVKWDDVYFFWGDERCVPPDNYESNYKMAHDTLLSHINVPEKNIFRIKTEMPHNETAIDYEKRLKEFFPDVKYPSFDIILLGLGEDGHTASLFKDSEALKEKEKWVKDNYVGKLDKWRITFTLPVINNAKNVKFLVSGENKAGIVKSVLKSKDTTLPASNINPLNGSLTWYLDRDAASLIKH